jgi:hypothetical protein
LRDRWTGCRDVEVDSTGFASNFSVPKDVGGGLGQEVIRALQEMQTPWVPARADGHIYKSRFILPVTYGLGEKPRINKNQALPIARNLREIF